MSSGKRPFYPNRPDGTRLSIHALKRADMTPEELEAKRAYMRAYGRRPAQKARVRAWDTANRPTRWRKYYLRSAYGLTIEQELAQLARQDNKCAICREGDLRLGWDHDHATKTVREMLCVRCNAIIGQAKEDPAILQAAIEYLRRHGKGGGVDATGPV